MTIILPVSRESDDYQAIAPGFSIEKYARNYHFDRQSITKQQYLRLSVSDTLDRLVLIQCPKCRQLITLCLVPFLVHLAKKYGQ
jgi:hypothetical protein